MASGNKTHRAPKVPFLQVHKSVHFRITDKQVNIARVTFMAAIGFSLKWEYEFFQVPQPLGQSVSLLLSLSFHC